VEARLRALRLALGIDP